MFRYHIFRAINKLCNSCRAHVPCRAVPCGASPTCHRQINATLSANSSSSSAHSSSSTPSTSFSASQAHPSPSAPRRAQTPPRHPSVAPQTPARIWRPIATVRRLVSPSVSPCVRPPAVSCPLTAVQASHASRHSCPQSAAARAARRDTAAVAATRICAARCSSAAFRAVWRRGAAFGVGQWRVPDSTTPLVCARCCVVPIRAASCMKTPI